MDTHLDKNSENSFPFALIALQDTFMMSLETDDAGNLTSRKKKRRLKQE
jgi:hypothetical protein